MRVLFDGFWWVHGPGANRTVMRDVVKAWRKTFSTDELVLVVRSAHYSEMLDELRGLEGMVIVKSRLWPQAVSNAIELPVLARKYDADVTIAHNYSPLYGHAVVFVHDLMFGDHPEWFSRAERAYFGLMPPSLRRATRVVTSSETEALRIKRLAPWVGKVRAAGLAVGSQLTSADAEEPPDCPETFALVVGRLNVRKNLVSAMAAARISCQITPDNPLVVVGDELHSGIGGVPDDVQDLVADGTVRFLGRVTDGNLRWLYEKASVTLYLSLDEGFGLPPVEAAHFGCPVIASDIPVLRETVGNIARFVDPYDLRSIAGEIDQVIAARRNGRGVPTRVVPTYTWERVATSIREAAVESSG